MTTSLTIREAEVTRLVAEGLLNKQIAHRLNMVDSTVKCHVSRVLEKLRLSSRGKLTLWHLAHADEAERERIFAMVRPKVEKAA